MPENQEKEFGIPPRTSASTALWAELLRKRDTLGPPTTNSVTIMPPLTPLDKNGTSMRVLLHDTQAHLDKFSDRAEKMFCGVEETKREITMVNTLFQREHEKLTEELVDLVNRSQTQLQASIGTPAQSDKLGLLTMDFNSHLATIEKQIDCIQLFNQAHTQTLQLHSQVLQVLQEQNGKVLDALLPLLPLLQAIPLHIESAQNHVTEVLKLLGLSAPLPRTLEQMERKRSSSTLRSDASPSPKNHKRARADTVDSSREVNEANTYPTDLQKNDTQHTHAESALTIGRVTKLASCTRFAPHPNIPENFIRLSPKWSPRLQERPQKSAGAAQHNALNQRSSKSSDVPVRSALEFFSPSRQHGTTNQMWNANMRDGIASGVQLDFTAPSSRPTADIQPPTPLSPSFVPNKTEPNKSRTLQQMSKITTTLQRVRAASSSPEKSQLMPASSMTRRQSAVHLKQSSGVTVPLLYSKNSNLSRPVKPFEYAQRFYPARSMTSVLQKDQISFTTGSRISGKPATKVRERRSPLREGRRVIPIGDSDDDSDHLLDM